MGKGCPRSFDPERYRRRNAVERCVGWPKGCCSIAARHDKIAVNFAATVQLALLRQYLRSLRP
jgi:transposase